MNRCTPLFFCTLGMVSLAAQNTVIVTAQDGVQAAINAASPGDVILLPNTGGQPDYESFSVFKGVTIRGNGCRVGASMSAPIAVVAVNVPAGQRAHLDGLDFSYSYNAQFGNVGTQIQVSGGTLSVQRCSFQTLFGSSVAIANAEVLFEGSTIWSVGSVFPSPSIHAVGSRVSLHDCSVRGPNAAMVPPLASFNAQPAVLLIDSTCHAERTSFQGGSNNLALRDAAEGFVMSGASRAWLSDCSVQGGSSTTGVGKPALVNNTATAAELANTQLQAGQPNAVPSIGPVVVAPLLRLAMSPELQRGTTSTLTFQGSAGNVFGLWLALDSASVSVPEIVEPIWFSQGIPISWGLLDGAGAATYPVVVPNVAALENATVWCQAIGWLALPLRASTALGGMIL